MSFRITGVVRLMNDTKAKLANGIAENEVDRFLNKLAKSIKQIEDLCAKNGATPDDLPDASRNAYVYLKGIKIDDITILKKQKSQTQGAIPPISIRGGMRIHDHLIDQINDYCDRQDEKLLIKIKKAINKYCADVEKICQRGNSTTKGIRGDSRKAYCFIKFLSTDENLDIYLQKNTRIRQMIKNTDSNLQFKLYFQPMERIYACSGSPLKKIKINVAMLKSDDSLLEKLIEEIINRTRMDKEEFSDLSETDEFTDMLDTLESIDGKPVEKTKGQYYDLDEVFNEVNAAYFNNEIKKPRLTWSKAFTFMKFGHFKKASYLIMVSLSLDHENVPKYVVGHVMHHEMLHIVHGAKYVDGRRMVHTPEFKQDERLYKHFSEANKWINTIARKLKSPVYYKSAILS